jgi:hypothetical protein
LLSHLIEHRALFFIQRQPQGGGSLAGIRLQLNTELGINCCTVDELLEQGNHAGLL